MEWLGFDRLVKLRRDGRKVIPDLIRMHEQLESGEWPGKEWRHVYASRNRPMSPAWASRVRDKHFVHSNYGKTGVHTFIVSDEPLDDDVIYAYELTWTWSPLKYGPPATPTYWWEES